MLVILVILLVNPGILLVDQGILVILMMVMVMVMNSLIGIVGNIFQALFQVVVQYHRILAGSSLDIHF